MWGKKKYGNKRSEVHGQWFDSKLEGDTYLMLLELFDQGLIRSIERQQTIKLTRAQIGYRVDFVIEDKDGNLLGVESKGLETDTWKIKKKLYRFYGPFPLQIYIRKGKKIVLDETIIPQTSAEDA